MVLVGQAFWSSLLDWAETHLLEHGRISPEDWAQVELADGVEDVLARLCRQISADAGARLRAPSGASRGSRR